MKKPEIFVLAFLLISFSAFILGLTLYIHKLMIQYAVDWELQLAVFGFLFVTVALVISKMLSRVDFDE